MYLEVSRILKKEGAKLSVHHQFTPEPQTFNGITFAFQKPITVLGEIVNVGETLKLDCNIETVIEVNCSRCTTLFPYTVNFSFSEVFIEKESGGEDNISLSDYSTFTGARIPIEEVCMSQLYLNIPLTFLCNSECKGLCTKCGSDLNIEPCQCDKNEIDPRLAILKKLL